MRFAHEFYRLHPDYCAWVICRMKPTKLDALALVRNHFDLTLSELCTLMNEPTQPKGLRDEIAIAAMAALIPRSNMLDIKWISNHAYLIADEMLIARIKE